MEKETEGTSNEEVREGKVYITLLPLCTCVTLLYNPSPPSSSPSPPSLRAETEASLCRAREEQIQHRDHFLAVEAHRDRTEFERVLR